MKFKALVINLDSCVERLTSIQTQCDQLGIELERVDAVQGNKLTQHEKSKVYDVKTNKKKYYKLLNDGEIGCYMSFIRCWQKIIDDDLDFALILEDDAVLRPELPDFISAVSNLAFDWDYIKLSHGSKQKSIDKTMSLGNGLTIGSCAKLPSTCTGQFVSKQGAKKLLKSALPIARPVDSDIQYWFEKNLKCFVVRPFPVTNAEFGSEINKTGDRRKVKARQCQRLWDKAKFEVSLVVNKHRQGKLCNSQ